MARPMKLDTVPLPKVTPDRPTGRTDSPRPASPEVGAALPASIDDALATKDRAINNRVPRGLWDLVSARADELGVNLRPFLTDALVRALEGDPATHRERVDETQRRQAYARIAQR
jgi:hypothetical protein